MKKETYFFGEYAYYIDEAEKEEAKTYLSLWKKYLLQKLNREVFSMRLIDEQYITREPLYDGVLCQRSQLALKVALELELRFQVQPFGVQ